MEDARFLEGGELALTVRFPPDPGREAWVLELPAPETPGGGSLRRLGPPEGAPALAVAPAGDRVAYLARGAPPARGAPRGAPGAALGAPLPDEVWVSTRPGDPGERIFTLPPDAAPERLADLSWSPDGRHLLVLSQRPLPTGARRARLLWLDAGPPAHLQALPAAARGPAQVPPAPGTGAGPQGVAPAAPSPAAEAPAAPGATQPEAPPATAAPAPVRQLATLPADVVPGSYSWAPGGQRVALLTLAGAVSAAGVVDATLGTELAYTYVADLDRGPLGPLAPLASSSAPATPGAFAPLSWSPDGRRLVFAARAPPGRGRGRSSRRRWAP